MSNTLAPIVTIKADRVVASSRDVAAYFEKRHDDVLRKINGLECSPEFTARNFAASTYIDRTGRSLPLYEMTRSGFVFLAMGFTGAKAARFKEDYINAFDRMEEELRKRAQQSIPDFTDPIAAATAWLEEAKARRGLEAQTAALTEEVDTISQTLAKNAVTVPRFMSTLDHRINQMQVSKTLYQT